MRQERFILTVLVAGLFLSAGWFLTHNRGGNEGTDPVGAMISSLRQAFASVPLGQNSALTEFETSPEGAQVAQCVEPNGDIHWKMLDPARAMKPGVKIVQADLTKNEKHMTIQWIYNTRTKVSELAYIGAAGKQTNAIVMIVELQLFCGFNFANQTGAGRGGSSSSDDDTSNDEAPR
jgi:hypothetical protein